MDYTKLSKLQLEFFKGKQTHHCCLIFLLIRYLKSLTNTVSQLQINNTFQMCLLWSDDLFVASQSAAGLQIAIDKVSRFYFSFGLQLNTKKIPHTGDKASLDQCG